MAAFSLGVAVRALGAHNRGECRQEDLKVPSDSVSIIAPYEAGEGGCMFFLCNGSLSIYIQGTDSYQIGKVCRQTPTMTRLLLLAFFLATFAAIVSAECPGGYTERGSSGNCYKVYNSYKKYCIYARQICKDEGGWVATIRNDEDQDWINNLYKQHRQSPCNQYYWIGANDLKNEGTFVWHQDGSAVTYTSRWEGGEPNNKDNEDCARVNSDNMSWNDEDYDRSREYCFVCEMFPRSFPWYYVVKS
ncbi:perlucin-like protein [Patiria miniata]|uniref:C-type lectin domain-containing protein n=1 Tax=Patiria miniata TaxID=46514 RepID=A0A913ZX69_PATMI|nr:perlucin-like protein [Patiria miniata]